MGFGISDITGAGALFDLVGGALDKIFPDKDAAAKAKLEFMKLKQSGDLKELDSAFKAITAEANSQDKWTSRARPSFLYVMYSVIFLCVFGAIIGIWYPVEVTQASENFKTLLGAIPEQLWWLFGTGYLGYSASRSYDKKKGTAK
jgi:hypothetical protein